MPLWILTRTHAPRSMVAILLLLNIFCAITLQTVTARASLPDRAWMAQRKAAIALLPAVSGLPLADIFGILAIAALIIAVAMLTGGELLSSAAGWVLSYGMVPAERRGEYRRLWPRRRHCKAGRTLRHRSDHWRTEVGLVYGAGRLSCAGSCCGPCARWAARTERIGAQFDSRQVSDDQPPRQSHLRMLSDTVAAPGVIQAEANLTAQLARSDDAATYP